MANYHSDNWIMDRMMEHYQDGSFIKGLVTTDLILKLLMLILVWLSSLLFTTLQ